MSQASLKIKIKVWKKLMKELKHRGHNGKRETGAFLLGDRDNRTITSFICYNDLDSHAFDTGIIVFHGDGYIFLWEYCSKHKLKVLADVHTHPGGWTGQSASDSRHPMIAQKGHIALIIPWFACKRNQLLKGVGVHEFLGAGEWNPWEDHTEIIELIK